MPSMSLPRSRWIEDLLLKLFNADELHVLAGQLELREGELSQLLPTGASQLKLAHELSGALVRRNLVDDRFFDTLIQKCPRQQAIIQETRRRLLVRPQQDPAPWRADIQRTGEQGRLLAELARLEESIGMLRESLAGRINDDLTTLDLRRRLGEKEARAGELRLELERSGQQGGR